MFNALKLGSVMIAAFVAATPADACWARRNCCTPTCAAPCAAPAPRYVEKKVTAYRCVTKEREVEVTVNTLKPREVEVKYTVNEMQTVPVKKKVTVCEPVMREVEFKYTEMQVTMVPETKKVITWKCDRQIVEEIVPVCHKRLVRCEPDPCAGCLAKCIPHFQVVTCVEQRKVCRTVVTRTPVETVVECMVRKCTPIEKTGKRMVCEYKKVEQEVTVNECRCVPVVHTCKKVVYDCVPVKKMVKECYNVMEPYETVVKVLVCP